MKWRPCLIKASQILGKTFTQSIAPEETGPHTAIVARAAQTATLRPQDVQRRLSLIKTLTGLAEARQARVSEETLKLYSAHLAEYEPGDVIEVIRAMARRKRAEGETAFPALGDLIDPLDRLRDRRRAEQGKARQWAAQIADFWIWAEEWMRDTGNDETELLKRFPAYRNTKASL